MWRGILAYASCIGAFFIAYFAFDARDPFAALKTICVGIAVLVLLVSVGFWDLARQFKEIRESVEEAREALSRSRDHPARLAAEQSDPEAVGLGKGIRFSCPHCSGELEFGAGAAGVAIRCPLCRRPIVVPPA